MRYNSDEKCLSIFGSKFPNIHLDRLSILDAAGTLQDEMGSTRWVMTLECPRERTIGLCQVWSWTNGLDGSWLEWMVWIPGFHWNLSLPSHFLLVSARRPQDSGVVYHHAWDWHSIEMHGLNMISIVTGCTAKAVFSATSGLNAILVLILHWFRLRVLATRRMPSFILARFVGSELSLTQWLKPMFLSVLHTSTKPSGKSRVPKFVWSGGERFLESISSERPYIYPHLVV